MDRISAHISHKEAVFSRTALRLDIDNTPDGYELGNMNGLSHNIFEPLREWVGGPIKINSFFRSKALNSAIGGSSRSQHCQGRAIDIDDTFGYKTNNNISPVTEHPKGTVDSYLYDYDFTGVIHQCPYSNLDELHNVDTIVNSVLT